MMSEVEIIEAGVTFTRDGNGRISAKGPVGVKIREAVLEHIDPVLKRLSGGPAMDGGYRWGKCDTCGLDMQLHRGGICWLCACALQKVQDEMKAKAAEKKL